MIVYVKKQKSPAQLCQKRLAEAGHEKAAIKCSHPYLNVCPRGELNTFK